MILKYDLTQSNQELYDSINPTKHNIVYFLFSVETQPKNVICIGYHHHYYKLSNQLTKTNVKKIGPDLRGTGNLFTSLNLKFSPRASNKKFKNFDLLGNPKMQF